MDFKTLKECSKVITKGTTPSSIGMSFSEDGINFVKSESITEKKFLDASIYEHISEETNEKLSRSQLQENDLLFSIAGAYLAKVGIVRKRDLPANTNQAVGIVRIDETQADYNYLYYYFSQKHIQEYAKGLSAQSAQPNLNLQILGDLEFIDIPLNKQKRIADLLSYIDDKIENNDSIIFNLENLAKTLYDYWFVQFDFPDANGNPYKTSGGKMEWNENLSREIPAGWEVSTIGRHVEVDRGISYSSADLEGEGIPMVNLNSFNTDASYKVEGLKTYSGKYAKDKVIKPYDLMICTTQQTAIDLTGQTNIIGKAMILPDCFEGREVVASMDLVRLHCDDIYGKYYLRLLLAKDYFHKYVTGYAIGTKIKHLHLDGLLNYYCEVPPNSLLQSFNKKMKDIEMKKSEIINENQRLCYLRDFLLPMLMNGQVTFRQ